MYIKRKEEDKRKEERKKILDKEKINQIKLKN